jgi:hypothetical protein
MTDSTLKFAVISHYFVGSAQPEATQALEEALRKWICKRPGFVGGAIHRSTDGMNVVVYTLWSGKYDANNFLQCPESKTLWTGLQSLGSTTRDSHIYRVGPSVSSTGEREHMGQS